MNLCCFGWHGHHQWEKLYLNPCLLEGGFDCQIQNNFSPIFSAQLRTKIRRFFPFTTPVTSGQVLVHWNTIRGQFGCDFITIMMKCNCNKNKVKRILRVPLFIAAFTFKLSSQVLFIPISLNALNCLIIFNCTSQSVKRDKWVWAAQCWKLYLLMETVVYWSCRASTGH